MHGPSQLLQRVSLAMEQRSLTRALEDLLSYRQEEMSGAAYGLVVTCTRQGFLHVYAERADERRLLEQSLLTLLMDKDVAGHADLHSLDIPVHASEPTSIEGIVPLPILHGPYPCGFLLGQPGEDEALWATALSLLFQHFQAVERAAADDYLTGLFNRSSFDDHLHRALELHERHRIPFVLGLLDINNFKQINDTKGHTAGDRVLQTVGRSLAHLVRQTDIVARYGGDEFAVLLSHANEANARSTVQRIKEELHNELGDGLSVAGGWVHLDAGKTPNAQDLVTWADEALYADKRDESQGRWSLSTYSE